jgi:hypothetical protein
MTARVRDHKSLNTSKYLLDLCRALLLLRYTAGFTVVRLCLLAFWLSKRKKFSYAPAPAGASAGLVIARMISERP